MDTQNTPFNRTVDNITERVCFYTIIGSYYVPAIAYRAIKKGLNFIDQKTAHLID
ncbi:hypothetical protein [Thalassotalea sp. PS06]|uniref:hypothetical protein n=1 Tax=Thalassotalea sp. PS06 TaxID=2594005 RepID=UPI00163D516B|nr:hypothetical protein [Thalassotalea sp. PS06]